MQKDDTQTENKSLKGDTQMPTLDMKWSQTQSTNGITARKQNSYIDPKWPHRLQTTHLLPVWGEQPILIINLFLSDPDKTVLDTVWRAGVLLHTVARGCLVHDLLICFGLCILIPKGPTSRKEQYWATSHTFRHCQMKKKEKQKHSFRAF